MINLITLENGIRVVYEKIPYMRSVACGIWVDNGSNNENDDERGISHFIEHMLFKGTKKRTANEIASEIDNVGGQLNAFTSKDNTCYYVRVLDTHLELGIDILSDMFFESVFDEKEIKKERKVINEEIKMYADLPDDVVSETLYDNIYKGCNYAYPVLGYEKTIKKFKHENFVNYMKKMYTASNIIVSIAGGFEEKEMLDLCNKYFGSKKIEIGTPNEKPEIIYNKSIVKTIRDTEQAHMIMGYESFDGLSDENVHTNLFSAMFGSNSSSTLYQIIREKYGYVYSLYSTNAGFHDTGLFSVYAGLNKKNINHVIETVDKEFKKIVKKGVDKQQLEFTKEQFKSGYVMGSESSNNRMVANGRAVLRRGRIVTENEILEKITNTTVDNVNDTISKIYTKDFSLSLVGDVKNIEV